MEKVFVRIRPGDAAAVLASLEQDWQQVFPAHPFTFTFLDQYIDQFYRADRRFARMASVFSLLTILVACLGLYGLVAFVTQLRTKEVGIRKVLGASAPGIVALFAKPFVAYILFANVLAWPLAYFAMRRWLQDFAYGIDLSWTTFAGAGGLALGVALLTVGYQAIRAALADPVDALRYE
jgi:putative ABC transport system permease protein